MLALSYFDRNIRAFNGHGTVLILWACSMLVHNQCMYGLPLAMSFIVFSAKVEYGILHVSLQPHRLETSILQEPQFKVVVGNGCLNSSASQNSKHYSLEFYHGNNCRSMA